MSTFGKLEDAIQLTREPFPSEIINDPVFLSGEKQGDITRLKMIRIKGIVKLLGSVWSQTPTRGHTRSLLSRGDEYFVAGLLWTDKEGEADRYYVVGPMTLEQLQSGYVPWRGMSPLIDSQLLNECGLSFVEEL